MAGTRYLIACGLAVLGLMLAGCSERESVKPEAHADEGEPAAETSAPPETSGELREKPKVTVPKGPPPTELQTKDIVVGEGGTATAGKQLTVNYVGVSYSNGQEFDSSFDSGQPFPFQLGAGMVIPGWDEGLEGMKVGGRRQLVIPPDKAYGAQGSPPAIGPNETLVFVVDLLGVQ